MLQDIKKSIAEQIDDGWKLDQIFFSGIEGNEFGAITKWKVGGIWYRQTVRRTREERRVDHGEFPLSERDEFYDYAATLGRR